MTGIQQAGIVHTDIRSIDDQHHQFVDLTNRFQDLANGDDVKLRDGVLKELKAYATFHFQSEENLMLQYDYPARERHAVEHRRLLAALEVHIDDVMAARSPPAKLILFLWKWLINHTNVEDKPLGVHLRARGAS